MPYTFAEVIEVKFQRIRDLRIDNELTQKEVASVLKIDQRVYSNYETGKRNIPIPMLIFLADYYNTSTDFLLGRTNNPDPPKQ